METKDFYCDFVLNNKLEVVKEFETETVLAFRHTKPAWDFHIVVVPKTHVTQLIDVTNTSLFGELFSVIKMVILKYRLQETNYKVITNGGNFQDSKHLHFHLVSGKQLMKNNSEKI